MEAIRIEGLTKRYTALQCNLMVVTVHTERVNQKTHCGKHTLVQHLVTKNSLTTPTGQFLTLLTVCWKTKLFH